MRQFVADLCATGGRTCGSGHPAGDAARARSTSNTSASSRSGTGRGTNADRRRVSRSTGRRWRTGRGGSRWTWHTATAADSTTRCDATPGHADHLGHGAVA